MLLTLLLSLAQPAAALEVKWWGIGPQVGTMAVPGNYPFAFPDNAKDEANSPLVEKIRGDISFGAHGVLYPAAKSRLGARALVGLGTGQSWSSWQFTLEYDGALVNEDGFQLLAGAGIGAGTERFGGTVDAPDGYLVANYFPVRGQVTALLRDRTRAYEISIYGTWHIVADQTYYDFKGADGITGAEADALVPGALYGGFGVEASVFFGDFRSKKSGGGGGGGGGG
ncbi:MAG: hypothetical protein Q8P41_00635 [Pseudomonadota bacterium]|nr:hypothetical protein [Pseudomonadota bacterium]